VTLGVRSCGSEAAETPAGTDIELEALGSLSEATEDDPWGVRARSRGKDISGLVAGKRASEIHATRGTLKSEDEVVLAGMHAGTRRPGDRDG